MRKSGLGTLQDLFRSLKPKDGSTGAYLFALGCVIVATLIRLLVDPVIPENESLLTIYVLAVLIAGVVGGVRAGALALVSSTVIAWWLFLPLRRSFVTGSILDGVRLIAFVAIGAFILWGAQRYRKIIESLSNEVAMRKLARERLQLLDHTPFLLARCNRDVRYLNASRSYAALFGLTADEIIGKRVVEVVGAKAFETMRPHIEAVLAGKRVEYEAEIKLANVEPRCYQVVSVPERDEENNVIGYIVSAIDVTERNRATEEKDRLEKLMAEMRLPQTTARVGIWDRDMRADRVSCTPELEAIFGLEATGLRRGSDFRDLIHPDDIQAVEARWKSAVKGREPFQVEFRIIRPDGQMRWLMGVGAASYDKVTGEPLHLMGNTIDITERKTAEAQAELHRKELTHLMRVATLGGLSGGIAHELSQPLASILANAQAAQAMLAGQNPDLKEVEEILKEIVQEDFRAGQVIRHLRQMMQKSDRHEGLINLNDLIASTLQLLHSELITRKIKVESKLKPDLPKISGDTVELQQVLINLIMNAIEAMAPASQLERTLSIVTEETKEGSVEVSIRDRGPGLPPDKLKRIFEPFFTTKAGGLGLGLSICSTIVALHRGKLDLRNASEGGMVATVSLPKAAQFAVAS